MFAEEIGGNKSRRRQEEAKAKRRQLAKQKKDAAAAAAAAKAKASLTSNSAVASSTTVTGNSTAADSSARVVDVQAASAPSPAVVAISSDSVFAPTVVPDENSSTKNSAVANALQQRQQRQNAQAQLKAAVKIQSFFRSFRSKCIVLQDQSTLLDKRFQDLTTLTNLIKQKTSTPYVPPPAMATALTRQLLFLTQSIRYQSRDVTQKQRPRYIKLRLTTEDSKKVQKLLDLVLLPGVQSSDENANPFLVWLQSSEGKIRLELLLRVCIVTATTSNVDPNVLKSCMAFIQSVLIPRSDDKDLTVNRSIMNACRNMLLSEINPAEEVAGPHPSSVVSTVRISKSKKKSTIPKYAYTESSLDIITILRHHLLYVTGGEPIPMSSDKLREGCISDKQRTQADALFQLVFKSIIDGTPSSASSTTERKNLMLRFVSEILTIPLLTWKTSDSSTILLLQKDSKNHQNKLLLITILETFVDHYKEILAAGDISLILCNDTALTACAATTTQCLLANLVQIGKVCVTINGSSIPKFDYDSACIFFGFIATLVDDVPLGTLSSRESAVEWISDGKGHHSPIVLSPVVIQQCKALLSESYVRKLFHCAIDLKLLKTQEVLVTKNERDLKHEKDLQDAGVSVSAASLAAKEARVDQSRSFWNSSGWARKMTKGVSKILSNSDKKRDAVSSSSESSIRQSGGKLMNTSLVSRKLAKSGGSSRTPKEAEKTKSNRASTQSSCSTTGDATRIGYTSDFLLLLCRVYGIILARWGGGGGEDIVKRVPPLKQNSINNQQSAATTNADLSMQSLLNLLCFSTATIDATWGLIQSNSAIVSDVYSIIDKGSDPIRALSIRPTFGVKTTNGGSSASNGAALLFVFVNALSHMLIITDDTEIHDMEKPLPLHQLRRCIQVLKQLLYRATCLDDVNDNSGSRGSKRLESNYFGLALISASRRTMTDLYDRSSRRPICVPKLWLIQDLMEKEIRRCKTEDDYVSLLSTPALRVCPFLVSFKRRLKLFERIVTTNRINIQGENSPNPFNTNPLKPGIPVRITRGRILEDGLATMNNLGRNMRQRIQVQYSNEAGMRESGVDAGGLFKEFWTDLSAIAFDLNYALFRTTDENCMYPNPLAKQAHGSDYLVLFEFLGRILGKALYEGITIHPQFAHFFLSFLRGDYNYFHMLPDLCTMDAQLYQNLMFLKTYEGDAEDLCLTFTVTNDDFGGNTEIPLIPNGGNVAVTDFNKRRYIEMVAKYHVVDRLREQSEAFVKGLRDVIDGEWLRIFNEPELQVLISGATDGKIDVEDMRQNCKYAGGFTGIDPTVNRFWKVVGSMTPKQQGDLLRFVTSCERPPPLGFASMTPPFTIQRVGIMRDGDKLPASSTCFNVLRLPTYSSEKVMKERLVYAIESGAGFELA